MTRYALVAGLLAGCAESAPGVTSPVAASQPIAADPLTTRLLAELDRSLRESPGNGVLLYQRAALSVQAGSPADALPLLERLDTIGWDVPLQPDEFEPLERHARYRAIAARIEARARRVGRSTVAFTVAEPDLIPEGIAVDPRSGTFYLGSVRKRKVLAIDARGGVSTFVPEGRDGLLGVLGIEVDVARDLLWVTSYPSRSMAGRAAGEQPTAGLMAFALADGSLRRKILFSDGERHLPNDVAIATDGTVYLTDSATGRLYRVPADRDVLEPVTPAGSLVYPNGIALAPDGRLYVAHLSTIAIVDPRSGGIVPMETVASAPLGGIDGLVLEGGALIAVQNGIGRPRIVSIALDPTGARAVGSTVLENDPASFELPTTACVIGGAVYTIANSQVTAFRGGALAAGRRLEEPRVLRTPL